MIGLNVPPHKKLFVSIAVLIASLSDGWTKKANLTGRRFTCNEPKAIMNFQFFYFERIALTKGTITEFCEGHLPASSFRQPFSVYASSSPREQLGGKFPL